MKKVFLLVFVPFLLNAQILAHNGDSVVITPPKLPHFELPKPKCKPYFESYTWWSFKVFMECDDDKNSSSKKGKK